MIHTYRYKEKKYSKAHVRNTLIVSDTYIQVHTVPGTKKYSKAHVRNTLIVSDTYIQVHTVPGTKKYSKAHVRNTLIVSDTYIQVHTVPGTKKYSKAHVRNTLIVSDTYIQVHTVPGTKKYSKAHVRNTLIVSDTYIQVHTVPGTKKYSKAHVRNTLIVSDSMTNRIHVNKLKNNIDLDCEDIILKKFSGATADEISHYVSHPLQMIHSSQMIIIAGTNDISNGCRDRSLNEYKVVNDIVNIARKAKTFGTKKIYISRIIVRWGYQYGNIITRINNLLENSCREEGFLCLDHLDITMRHISNDGLHLNIYGNTIMKMNLLKCFYSFNPFLCDFDKFYDYAL